MIDLIFSFIAEAIAEALEMAFDLILPVLGFDFSTFANAFPVAQDAYYIFRDIALGIAILIGAWHFVPFFMSWFGISGRQLKSTPLRELMQVILAVIMIYFGNHILQMIMDIAQIPFQAFLDTDASGGYIGDDVSTAIDPVLVVLSTLFYKSSILVYIIALLMIGMQLIKLLLEAVERYVILCVLVYASPLAFATLASEETSGIFKRFFSMFIGQCLLLILNVWSIKMAISLFSGIEGNSAPILALLVGYAFLRLSLRFDSYLNQLGLNSATTGAGLGAEIVATGAMLMGGVGKMMGGKSSAGSSGMGNSGVLGFANKVSDAYGRFAPSGAAADYLHAAGASAVKTGRGAVEDIKSTFQGTSGGFSTKINSAVHAAVDHVKTNGLPNLSDEANAVENIYTGLVNKRAKALKQDVLKTQPPTDDTQSSDSSAVSGAQNPPSSVGSDTQTVPPSTSPDSAPASDSSDTTGNKNQSEPPVPNDKHIVDYGNREHNAIARNSGIATSIFNTFAENPNTQCTDTKYVGSIIQGIGATEADPSLRKFVSVAYDKINTPDAKDPQFRIDNNKGIEASYVENGRKETLKIVNSKQFHKQTGGSGPDGFDYQSFQTPNGQTFYYARTTEKITPTSPGSSSSDSGKKKPSERKNPSKNDKRKK